MSVDADRWFGPGEMSKKLGVTAKALRVYEREGLVAPMRAESGWRAYGPTQVERLHQIIALRDLGLSLKKIRDVVEGNNINIRAIISIQQKALEDQRRKIDCGIALLTNALQKLDAGGTLSLDDLMKLTRETVVMTKSPVETFKVKFDAILAERLPDGSGTDWTKSIKGKIQAAGMNTEEIKAEFEMLMSEAARLMNSGDENSDEAKQMIHRWRAIAESIGRPPKPTREAIQTAFDEAVADPAVESSPPFNLPAIRFLQKVESGMKARGELT